MAKLGLRIGADPHCNGSFKVGDGSLNLRLLHMRYVYPKGRHLMLYRVGAENVDIIRVLHDEMNIARHIKTAQSILKT
jgi:plasmid stabilization system protein ParE